MVLVLLADAREVADDLDTEFVEHLSVADTRALEDLGRAQRTGREHDVLVRADLSSDGHQYVRSKGRMKICLQWSPCTGPGAHGCERARTRRRRRGHRRR